jgi:hypothetical protein
MRLLLSSIRPRATVGGALWVWHRIFDKLPTPIT